MAPAVTCLVCAYNYEAYIAEAIESALAQDYPADRLEILVIDDGSTDGTPQALATFGDRIRVVRQENAGLNAATARGIAEATGEYIALLDADDVWLPEKVRLQVELLEARPEVGLVFSDMELMDGDGRVFAPSFHRQFGMLPAVGPRALGALLRDNTVPAPSIMFRRSLAGQVLPVVDEAAFQDWWLGVRVAEVAELACLPVALVRYRVHGGNMAVASKGEKWIANIRRDNVFRRWMLRELPLAAVTAEDLIAAWRHFDGTTGFVAQRAGTTVRDEIPVTAQDRRRLATECAAAAAAERRDDAHAAVRHWLAARACDPWDAGARAGWDACVAALETGDDAAATAPPTEGAHADRIAWAEDRYAEGDLEAAIAALVEITEDTDEPAVLAHAHADLAVIAVGLERWADATSAARSAVRCDPAQLAALEVLAACSEQAGDHLQAGHWFRRMTAVDPSDASSWRELGRVELLGARFAEAVSALETAARISPLPLEDEHRLRVARDARAAAVRAPDPVPAGSARAPRVLICVDYFFPSIGGLEHLAEGIGSKLQELGWTVEVACRHLPERRVRARKGMLIHEVHETPREELRRIVKRGRFDAVLAMSDPYAWPVPAALRLPRPGPRIVVIPCVTANADKWVREVDNQRMWRELLERADVVVQNSERGFDAKLNRDVGVAGVYVPQAIEERVPAALDVRAVHGLREDVPLLLYVANLHPHKNHAGLLEALAGRPGDWQLLLAGHPSAANPEEGERVAELAARDPRVTLVPGFAPEEVAAAMRAADLFLCPSHSDAVPLVIQESMCAGLPWIATPAAGAVHDWAGGLILPVEDFGGGLDHLLANPEALATLGRNGRVHWEACFHYDVAGACYDALLRGADRSPQFPPPADALAGTDAVRAAAYDALVGDAQPQLAGAAP